MVLIVGLVVVFVIKTNVGKVHLKYASLESVLEKQNDVLGNKYDNLILPDKITDVYPEKLYEYYTIAERETVTDEEFEKAFSFVNTFTNGTVDKEELKASEENNNIGNYSFSVVLEDEKGYLGVVDVDGLCDVTTMDALRTRTNEKNRVNTILLKYGEKPEGSYDIGGEEYSVEDALKYCEKYIEENHLMDFFESGIKIEPSYVFVIGSSGPDISEDAVDMNTNYYKIYYTMYRDGVPVSDCGCASSADDGKYFFGYSFCLMVDKKDHVGQILRTGQPTPSEKTEITSDVVTLKSALAKTSEYLSGGYEYNVREIGIRYCALKNSYTGDYYTRPYWRIVLNEKYTGDVFSTVTTTSVYIDLGKGDIYMFDDESGKMLEPQT